MKKMIVIIGVLIGVVSSTQAKNVSVAQLVKASLPQVTEVMPKQLILTGKSFDRVKSRAKVAIASKVYRYYDLKAGSKTAGYGILVIRNVRSKKATVLYVFSPSGVLRFAEVLAFSEPPEYLPSQQWMDQLKNKNKSAELKVGRDITAISGATLSARSVTEGARVAQALFEELTR